MRSVDITIPQGISIEESLKRRRCNLTEEQFWSKYNMLRSQVDDLLRNRAHNLLASGAIDLAAWGDDFQLPKIVITDALQHEADQWAPLSKEGKKTLNNLSHF